MAQLIQLTQGMFSIVDDEDAGRFYGIRWSLLRGRHTNYARGKIRGQTVYMHRIIMSVDGKGVFVDHINRNGLDNRRSNLRICNRTQNGANSMSRSHSSLFRGVFIDRGRIRAAIAREGRVVHLGYFAKEVDAAAAYNRAAIEVFGSFASLNLIPTEISDVNNPVGSQDFGFCNLGTDDSQAKLAE